MILISTKYYFLSCNVSLAFVIKLKDPRILAWSPRSYFSLEKVNVIEVEYFYNTYCGIPRDGIAQSVQRPGLDVPGIESR